MNDIISIIVPVYNTKDYLKRCVDSIINQTYTNIEILLIDDGSTDGSSALCDELAKKDNRIVVIHRDNGGVTKSRICGIEASKGDYIGFVDSDDFISHDMYKVLYEKIIYYKSQVACTSMLKIDKNNNLSLEYGNASYDERAYDTNELMSLLIENKRISSSLCDKLFKKESLVKIKFEDMYYEDYEFMHRFLYSIKRGVSVGKALYYYLDREGSRTKSTITDKKLLDYVKASTNRYNFYKTNCVELFEKEYAYHMHTLMKNIYFAKNNKNCKNTQKKIITLLDKTYSENSSIKLPFIIKFLYISLKMNINLFYLLCDSFYSTRHVYRVLKAKKITIE